MLIPKPSDKIVGITPGIYVTYKSSHGIHWRKHVLNNIKIHNVLLTFIKTILLISQIKIKAKIKFYKTYVTI